MTRRNDRGRAGKSRRGARSVGKNQHASSEPDDASDNTAEATITWCSNKDTKDSGVINLFLSTSTFAEHLKHQEEDPQRYLACFHVLLKRNIQVRESSKTFALAATWVRKDYKQAEYLLSIPGEVFGIKEVIKAVTILDSARQMRAYTKKLERLQAQGCKKTKLLNFLKSSIKTLEVNIPIRGTLSGALISHIKAWVKTIPAERLEFFAQHFPFEPWKKLADLCHLNPDKDMPQCAWFLPVCYGQPLPDLKSVVDKEINESNICAFVMNKNLDYTIARKWKDVLDNEAKERIAMYSKLDTVIWYYEELACKEVDDVLYKRMQSGEETTLSYGKLMERLLYFTEQKKAPKKDQKSSLQKLMDGLTDLIRSNDEKPFKKLLMQTGEKRLKEINFELEAPVAVLGDMSYSMDVAIRTSNIIASLVTAVTNAELVFFDDRNVVPPFIPKNIEKVLELCDLIRARGSTSPAVSLWPFYESKKIMKTFFVVTDEEENTNYNGHNFQQLFSKYYHEVYPARLVFISFLSQKTAGQMVSALRSESPEIKVMQFCFNQRRPDLTKLDNVFGVLSLDSETFSMDIDRSEGLFKENCFDKILNEFL